MNGTPDKAKNGKKSDPALGLELEPVAGSSTRYHEHELRSIAAFRLRDAANRIALLVGMTESLELQTELLEMYDRLIAEERGLLVRSVRVLAVGGRRDAAAKRTA